MGRRVFQQDADSSKMLRGEGRRWDRFAPSNGRCLSEIYEDNCWATSGCGLDKAMARSSLVPLMFGEKRVFKGVICCKSAERSLGLSHTCMDSCWSSCAWFSLSHLGREI